MRKRDQLAIEVSALDGDGAGVAEHEGVRVHAAGALPGERALVTVEHLSPHRAEAWAAVGRVERASPDRVAPACAAFGRCGGCPLEHLAYAAQVAWKGARTAELLAGVATVEPCVPSPRPLGYRNRSKLVYGLAGGKRVLGAFAPRSHTLVDLAGCRVAEPPLDEVARALAQLCDARAIPPYDERTGEGALRHVVLRVNHAGEVLATLVTAVDDWPAGAELARALVTARPEIVGVVQNLNRERTNRIYGDENRALAGGATLDEHVGAVRLRLSPTAFFQVNRDVAALIYADLAEAAQLDGSERVVDVYSGVGGVALTLAAHAREVVGIEEVAAAVDDARASAVSGGRDARFVCADAARGLAELDGADVVVLNPPRKGCDRAVLDEVARLVPRRVLYVSCSPETLARDLALLGERGFSVETVRPYDMLPQTPHVEALAVLNAKDRRPARG